MGLVEESFLISNFISSMRRRTEPEAFPKRCKFFRTVPYTTGGKNGLKYTETYIFHI